MTGRRSICTLIFCFIVTVGSAQKKESLPPELDKYITKVLKTFGVPGVGVSIVKDGKVLLAKGYGVKQLGTPDAVDEHTLFLIASNTKAFTATALAMLVQEKKINWDDRVINHLPWFRMGDDYITMHMTIRDLLVHHSGLAGYSGDAMLFPPSTYTRKQILEKLPLLPLAYDFRTIYAYDNVLYLAAGEVIAAVSGISWEEFIKTRIFDVIGMKESLSRFSALKEQKNVSMGHARYLGTVEPVKNFMQNDIGDAGDPVGGIVSNATDMAKWLITQLDSGRTSENKRLYNPAATTELWKIVRPMPISKSPKELSPAQYNFWGYALGFRTYNYRQYKVVGHGGALGGFVSQIAMVPELNLGISVLTNQQSGAAYWSIIYHILDYYMQNKPFDWLGGYKVQHDSVMARALRLKEKQSTTISNVKNQGSLEKYAGKYNEALLGEVSIIKEGDGFVLRFANSPAFVADLNYAQYNTFNARFRNFGPPADAYLTFFIKPDGSIEQAKLQVKDRGESTLDFDEMTMKPVK